jgi:cytochrome c-type biogenesis protein CcmH/NrfG
MTGKRMALVMAVLLGAYLFFAASRAIDFVQAGGVVPILLGLAILLFPLIGLWVLWREWQFGRATEALGQELAARGELPVDDLPRRPSGRPVREAADARFAEVRTRVEADPDSWERWFELATAYDAAGDRKRARKAMRTAIALHAGAAPPSPPGPGH